MTTVTLYGGDSCPACDAAKKYLGALDIEFTFVNIRESAETTKLFLEKFNVRSIPVLETDKGYFVGFSPKEYQKIL